MVDLRGFRIAGLRNVVMRRVDLSFATNYKPRDLYARDLGVGGIGYGSRVSDSIIDRAALNEENVSGRWERCTFLEATFQEIDWMVEALVECDFRGALFTRCKMSKALVSKTSLEQTEWRRGMIHGVTFEDVSFRGASFDRPELSSCKFIRCVFDDIEGQAVTASNEFIECNCPPALEERDFDIGALLSKVGRHDED